MNNTFIENKLKEHICRFNDGEQNCDCYIAGITDYHNHIVEKLKNELGDFAHTKYAGCTREDGKDYYWYENEVVYIVDDYFKSLQDTNQK